MWQLSLSLLFLVAGFSNLANCFPSDLNSALPRNEVPPVELRTKGLSISQQKCREYAKLASDEGACKITTNTTRAGNATLGELPHMVLVGYETKLEGMVYICGGTLISENFVMTAAYCLLRRGERYQNNSVLLGELVLNNETDAAQLTPGSAQLIRAAEVIIHPRYNESGSLSADISLIRLAEPAKLSPYVRPACLSTGRHFNQDALIASGWGRDPETGWRVEQLRKIKMIQVPYEICKAEYSDSKINIDESTMLCASHPLGKYNIGAGDGGGPLTTVSSEVHCSHEVVGVISFGANHRGQSKIPEVFARVDYYADWIEGVVWPGNLA